MMALYLEDFDEVQKVIHHCLNNGLITDWFFFANNCIRIAPPLIITEEQIRASCAIIIDALNTLQ